ncbi:MAG: hypothetical protein JKY65_14165 [Planctomycetes bacterium]|nr:hypothetical protein [Planctomycetota bacterium]
MTDPGTSLSLTPGFQTAFRVRAVPHATLSFDPVESFQIDDVESWVDLEGSCEFLPDQIPCQVTWLVQKGKELHEYDGYSCKLEVSGTAAKATLMIDASTIDLVGRGAIGVVIAPDFPYCEPARVEPGAWHFDNEAHVTVSPKPQGCRIGTVLTLTPKTTGAFSCGALKLELSESDENERAGGEAQIHTILWPDGDREPRKWRIGCTSVEGPPTFDYREFGEAGALEFGATLFHGHAESADDACTEPAWRRVWYDGKLVTNVPFPRLDSFEITESFVFGTSVVGKISGFAPGLDVPLWIGAAIAKWGALARWHPIPTSLEDNGTFSSTFAFPPGWDHVDDLYGMSCGAISEAEAFAGVIDYDVALVSPAAGAADEIPPRSADKATGAFVVLGQPAAGLLTSSTGRKDLNTEVIKIAETKSGGTYKWAGSDGEGCPTTIKHSGTTVIKAASDGSTYCCGYTFWVMITVAKKQGLLDGISGEELREMRVQWFGAVKGNATINEKQVASALKNFGLGKEIAFANAKKGDFVQLWRSSSGHSVIFLNWVTDDQGKRVGLRYRSSNPGSGIGEREEKFTSAGGRVIENRCYVGRLMAKVSRPPQIVLGKLAFFTKKDSKKTYVQHSDIASASDAGTKVFAEIEGKADSFPFASVTTYKTRAGITTTKNGKGRPHLSLAEATTSRAKVIAAVGGNEGSFVDVQAYDNAYLTHGMSQWTQSSKSLFKLLDKYKKDKPALFAKYFQDREVELQTNAGNLEVWIEGTKIGDKETSLHLAYCLWQSGYDTELQDLQVEFLAARIDKFYPLHGSCKKLGDYYTSEQSIAHLLDLHVNRPAYVGIVAQRGIDAFLKANPTKTDASKWSEADERGLVEKFLSIRHTYKSQSSPMTQSAKRAKKIKGLSQLSTARGSFVQ